MTAVPLAPPWRQTPHEQGLICGAQGVGCHRATSPWPWRGPRTHPGLDGDFSAICEAAPGGDGKPGRGGWSSAGSKVPSRHIPGTGHGRVTRRAQPVPARGVGAVPHPRLSPSSLFVCQHITCGRWMTREGGILFFFIVLLLFFFFFEESQNICIPTGTAPGHWAWNAALGSRRERGHPAPWGGSDAGGSIPGAVPSVYT